jgi:hypothetical protein
MSHQHTDEDRKQFIELFRSHATDVSATCRAMKIHRDTFYDWYKKFADFKQAVDAEREAMKDFVESQQYRLIRGIPKVDKEGKQTGWIERPDARLIENFLNRKCKDRGYTERIETRDVPPGTGIDMERLTPEQRQQLYALLELADPEGGGDNL